MKNWQYEFVYYKHPDVSPTNEDPILIGRIWETVAREDFTTPEAKAFEAGWEALHRTLKNQVINVFNEMKG